MTDARYQVRAGLAWRELEDTVLVVDASEKQFHSLSEVGGFVWKRIQAGCGTEEELVQEVVNNFEVDKSRARDDVRKFLAELVEKKLLIIRNGCSR